MIRPRAIPRASLFLLSLVLFVSAESPAAELISTKPAKETVILRHLEEKAGDWKVAESLHFRLLHNQPVEKVLKIAYTVEKARQQLEAKWFGDSIDEWNGKCRVNLHATRREYVAKTGQKNSLGHMRVFTGGGSLSARSIHVSCDDDRLLADVLPHEVCHAVMANRLFGRTPRWADEGMAVLAESPEGVAGWLDLLPMFQRKGDLFSVEVLLTTDEAEHIGTREYYSQSASLVLFLSERKGPKTFIQFLRDTVRTGNEAALKKHYGFSGIGELDREWRKFAFTKVGGK